MAYQVVPVASPLEGLKLPLPVTPVVAKQPIIFSSYAMPPEKPFIGTLLEVTPIPICPWVFTNAEGLKTPIKNFVKCGVTDPWDAT